MNTVKIAAIVAAYNEEETIGPIIRALAASRSFGDIIVISDGSTDRTAEIARTSGATMVHQFPWKHGKGAAMMHGVAHTDAPILFFCDADLKGFRVDHVKTLLEPVMRGKMAMCVGLRDRGTFIMRLTKYLPLIGGERVMLRKVFDSIPDKFMQGFMVESSLNYYCRMHRLPYGTVPLVGLHIRRKMQKVGFTRGLGEYVRMWYQILRAMIIVRVARWRGDFV